MTLGKKRKLPFLILAGILIAFFGVPLGLGGLGAAIGLIIGVLALIVSFYVVAFSLILAGWLSAVIMIVRIFSPGFLDPWIDIYPLVSDPTFNTVIYIVGALLIAALGFGLLWLGSRLMRGVRFVFRLLFERSRTGASARPSARRRPAIRSKKGDTDTIPDGKFREIGIVSPILATSWRLGLDLGEERRGLALALPDGPDGRPEQDRPRSRPVRASSCCT